LVLSAGGLRHLLVPGLGRGIPYLTFYPAVALAAILGGLPAGIVATALSVVLIRSLILGNIMSGMDWAAMSIFVISDLLVAFMAGLMRKNRQLLYESLAEIQSAHVNLKETNVSLCVSERKFSTLFQSMTEGVAIHELVRDDNGETLDYRILAANPAFQTHTGIEPASAIGRLGSELFGIPGAPYVEAYSRVALTGEPCVFETFFPPLGRSYRISVFSPEIGKFATVFVDITDYKKKEELLQTTLQRLELATASADMGVWDWNLQAGTMIWNARMFEIYGITRGEIHGTVQDWKDGLHPEDLERAAAECEAALRGEATFDTAFRLRHRDGAVWWIKANGLVLRDENGKPVRMIGLNQDITEEKTAQEQICRLAEDLERRVEERTQQLEKSESHFRLLLNEGCVRSRRRIAPAA